MALETIEYGSQATSPTLNNNFTYLDNRISSTASSIGGSVSTLTTTVTSLSNTVAGITTPSSSFKATLLGLLYPIGSIYLTIDTSDTCPIQTQLGGTWELVSTDRVLQGASTVAGAGGTKAAGLPNISGTVGNFYGSGGQATASGAFGGVYEAGFYESGNSHYGNRAMSFNASWSNSIYGNSSTVQPPAYLVNVWKRTA